MLIDTHCHLNEFSNIEEIIKNAKNKNVLKILSNSVDLKTCEEHLKLKQNFQEIEIALGLHPSNSVYNMSKKEIETTLKFAEDNIEKALVIGEIGLDFKHADTEDKKKTQRQVLRRQLLTSLEFNKGVVIHSRRSHENCFKILNEFKPEKVLMHWFYDLKYLNKIVNSNYFVSIGPSVFKEKHVQEFAKQIPLENLLLETDSPVPFNGKKAKPELIPKIAQTIAELKECSIPEIEKACFKNFKNYSKQNK